MNDTDRETGTLKSKQHTTPMPLVPISSKQEDESNVGTIAFAGDRHTWSKEELKEQVMNGEVPTAITDAGVA